MEELSVDLLEKIFCQCSEDEWIVFRESKEYQDKVAVIESKNSTWKSRVDYLIGFESDLTKDNWKDFYYILINSIPGKDKRKSLTDDPDPSIFFKDCAFGGKNEIVELLISSPYVYCESNSMTLINITIEKGNLELLQIFHKSGRIDFTKKDELEWALLCGKVKIAEFLVDNRFFDIDNVVLETTWKTIVAFDADILLTKLLAIPKLFQLFKPMALVLCVTKDIEKFKKEDVKNLKIIQVFEDHYSLDEEEIRNAKSVMTIMT